MHREFIQKLTNLVEANLANEKFGPEELAKEAGMSHSNLNRKLKTLSYRNASQFIREVRLKKARELLQNEDLTAAEISYRVGFGSPTYFNKCFHEYFGYAPGELKNHEPGNEPVELPAEAIPKKSGRTKMLTGLVIGLIIIIIIPAAFFLIQKVLNSKEKSIAVLPFINDSQDTTNVFFINGMTETVTDKLAKINDLKVTSRNSVERYRNNKTKSTP
ncbi:MAG TPA: helix-turn-helix domain-containing protein, partial [Draconibacterium sp.]|nr:helix-turn-helix domain-containing protein [Draconibacterium sp.]